MISFRFHLVSLVAVFMALGVGVLTGTTVINRGVVAQLESRTDDLSGDLSTLRDQFNELQAEADVWGLYGEQTSLPVLAGRLTGQEIVLVTQEGTSEESVTGVRRALEAAGAQLATSLSVSGRMALTNDGDREALALILGLDPEGDPDALTAEAAMRVATRLVGGPNGTDTLERLLSEDFLVVQGPGLTETGLRALGGPDQAVVVVAGGPAPSELEPSSFLVPLVTDLALGGMAVVAGEPAVGGEDEPPFVTILRGEAEISSLLATQDNVDLVPGQVGLTLALEDLLQGEAGHFGVKEGASQILPDLT